MEDEIVYFTFNLIRIAGEAVCMKKSPGAYICLEYLQSSLGSIKLE